MLILFFRSRGYELGCVELVVGKVVSFGRVGGIEDGIGGRCIF